MTRNILHVPVEWKAGSGSGELEGYASVFGNVDEVGDVVMPGAFKRTIGIWQKSSQPMPLIADHQMSTDGVIGSITSLNEDRHGLRFKSRFSRSEKAQRIRQDVLDGHYRGTSFTYEVMKSSPGRGSIAGKAVARFLDELRLFEITLSPFPVNQLAGVTAAKASTDEDPPDISLAGWLDSMGHAIAISDALARKAALDQLVRGYPTDLASGPGDAPATATDPATTDETSTGGTSLPDDAYALSILTGPPDGAPTGDPPNALPGPLVELEQQRSIAEIDALEADIRAALEG
jgi:HK97 family phage prohead protease